MAIRMNKLSALVVGRAREPGYYGDGGGLVLQVSGAGARSWLFRYSVAGRRHEMGLGSCLAVDLVEARKKARQCRLLLSEGRDPLAMRRQEKQAGMLARARQMTFEQCAASYIAAHRHGWRNAKHVAQWENTLAAYVFPLAGALPVAAIDTDLVVKVLDAIWLSKTETATRIRGRIECILDWATVSGFRQGENPARWKGHLENLLANPNKVSPVKNRPALPWQEIGRFMAALSGQEGIAARALAFAILTAARSGEVRGARWPEIDLEAALWTIPAQRMKAGKEHRVPLSGGALALLRAVPRQGDIIFSGRKRGTQLSDMSLTAVLRRMQFDDITVHGFRSSFRDWCAEAAANAFSREVCEHALAHRLPDRVEAAYRRGDLFDKRIVLMQAWSDFCTNPAPPVV